MEYSIRPIEAGDNGEIERVIRSCLLEFGAPREGTAWSDPELGRLSGLYGSGKSGYWVAVDETGRLVGGAGIGPVPGAAGVCELQKMYCLPEARGTGASHKLMDRCLGFAEQHYDRCYLETLENMRAAQRFYEKYGFHRITERLGDTGHFSCDVLYLKEL